MAVAVKSDADTEEDKHMTKKHFIALANCIIYGRFHDKDGNTVDVHFSAPQIEYLADFCHSQNVNFNRQRWFDYINGNCGPGGGKITTKGGK